MNDYPTSANGQYELASNLSHLDEFGITIDEATAAYYISKAIELGHAEILKCFGGIYKTGRHGIPKDKKKAVFLYTEAVRQYLKDIDLGSADAMIGLSTCYIGGSGVRKDLKMCDYWSLKAAEQYAKDAERGDAHALYYLSILYTQYIMKDINKARICLLRAAELGSLAAQLRLGQQYCEAGYLEFPQDLNKAIYWYTKAAEQNRFECYANYSSTCSAEAQRELGDKYYGGWHGFPKDIDKAIYWYTKADAAYSGGKYRHVDIYAAIAADNLGEIYAKGNGVSIDKEKASYWYTKAAEQGRVYLKYQIGLKYYQGDGVPKDVEKAKRLITLAAERGEEDAQKALKRLSKGKSPV